MTSLPERLRSRAKIVSYDSTAARTMYEAADELDRRAEEINRLRYKLSRVGRILDPHYEIQIPDRDSDEEGSGEVGAGSDDPYVEDQQEPPDVEFTFNPGPFTWLVFAHPDGSVSMRRG